jgi:hypothetical protein
MVRRRPVFTKLQLVHDEPAGQPLIVAKPLVTPARHRADAVDIAHLAHPPPGVPVFLRSLRLAL